MISWIKKILYHFSTEAKIERHQKAMYEFLSQAQDRVHLEALEREWERHHQLNWR